MQDRPLASKTRQIESIPLHVLRRGKIHLLPIYQLASLSSVGRELILNQGSAKYQDMVYRNQPEGRFVIGKVFDRYLLGFPTAVGCRSRLAATQETLMGLIDSIQDEHVQILDLACGYAHCLIGTMARTRNNGVWGYGLDLDKKAVAIATARASEEGIMNLSFHVGDALHPEEYPVRSPHIIVLNGLAQYLPRNQRVELYLQAHRCLKEGGYLVTDYFCDWTKSRLHRWWKGISEEFLGMKLEWLGREEVEATFSQLPFREVRTWYGDGKVCLMILARK